MSFKIYCCYPISGMSYNNVVSYYNNIEEKLKDFNFKIFHPMIAKESLRTELEFRSKGYDNIPVSTNHAIIERDRWMVEQSDIVFANLLDSKDRVSIGTCMELAWAHDKGKHTIVCMQKENIHQHAFVIEASDVIFENIEDAFIYLSELSKIR